MKKSDLFLTAIRNLKNRKTRTRLTVIGVVIGTCAIVIMVSIGVGIDKMLTAQFESDTNLTKMTVYEGYDESPTGEERLKLDDRALEYFSSLDHVELAVPVLSLDEYVKFSRGKYSLDYGIRAVDTNYMEQMGFKLVDGSFANKDKNTVYFGEKAVINFYDSQGNPVKFSFDSDYNVKDCEIDAMKDIFTIGAKEYNQDGMPKASVSSAQRVRVGGVLKYDYRVDYETDRGVYIDIELAKDIIRQYNILNNVKQQSLTYENVWLYVDNMNNVDEVKAALSDKGFSCYSDNDELEYTKKIMLAVQLVLGAIGAISMFVAAFGISNTMVMSVYERTKEIGVMKVLGCELKDIKAMFLYEAGTIGLLGGTIGLAISYVISIVANLVARAVMSSLDADGFYVCVSAIPPWLALLGIAFSVGVGVVAGLSPANRSVKVSALTAIHNE